MTAPLSEQEIAETLAIIEDGERVHGDWAAHPGSPAHAQRWIQWAADNRYVWPRIFATIRADRARIAAMETSAAKAVVIYNQQRAKIASLEQQLAERTRELDEVRGLDVPTLDVVATLEMLRAEAYGIRPCCQEWATCAARCLPLSQHWRARAEHAEADREAAVRRAEAAEKDAGKWRAIPADMRDRIDAIRDSEGEKPNANLP